MTFEIQTPIRVNKVSIPELMELIIVQQNLQYRDAESKRATRCRTLLA